MTDDMKLSQEEIDALLKGATSPASDTPTPPSEFVLTDEQKDALGEIGNISFGSAATSLSTLLQQRVDITTPTVSVIHSSTVNDLFPKPYVMVAVDFSAGLKGSNALAIEVVDAKVIADLMLGGDGSNVSGELNELHLSAVGEAMNQMMGGAATSMSQIFGKVVNISPPVVKILDMSASHDELSLDFSGWIASIEFQLRVGTLIDSKIMQLIPAHFAVEMTDALGVGSSAPTGSNAVIKPKSNDEPKPKPQNENSQTPVQPLKPTNMPQNVVVGAIQAAPTIERQVQQGAAAYYRQPEPQNIVEMPFQRPEFADFSNDAQITGIPPRNLALLLDVPLNVTVELGRASKAIRDILELTPGAILELDKLAGEPVDILVNNKRIAIGEVVVIDENFGVRVTDIISPTERLRNLQ